MKKSTNIWLGLSALSLGSMLLLAGCSKKDSPAANAENKSINSTGNAKLTVVVSGINEVNDADAASIKASANQATPSTSLNKGNKLSKPKIVHSGGIDAVLSVEDEQKPIPVRKTMLAAASMPSASASPLTNGYKYRILIYNTNPDGSNGSLVSSTQFVVGTPGIVNVDQGKTYNWYTYSYNDALDVADVADYTNPNIQTSVNRDMLYASGKVTTGKNSAGDTHINDNPISITFNHMVSRLGIVLNGQGMFSPVISGTVQIAPSSLQVGTLDIKSGNIINSAFVPAGSPLVQGAVIKQYQAAMKDTAKIAYFYTSSNGTPLQNVKVTVTGFTLKSDASEILITPIPYINLNSLFTFPTVTPVFTSGKLLKIDLLSSSLTVYGIKWARTNLYLSTSGAYAFRMIASDNLSIDGPYLGQEAAECWNYGATTPTGTNTGVDPCTLVYPKGHWRMPTKSEIQLLVTDKNSVAYQTSESVLNGTGTLFPNLAYPADTAKQGHLVFPYRSSFFSSNSTTPKKFLISREDGLFMIWGSDMLASPNQDLAPVFIGGHFDPEFPLFDSNGTSIPAKFDVGTITGNILSANNFYKAQVYIKPSQNALNIRCVRAN